MSKMSELDYEIKEMLEQDYVPATIARILEIPISWVYESIEMSQEESELVDW